MKNFLPLRSLLTLIAIAVITTYTHRVAAQAGAVYTVAGGGSSSADGVPATSAQLTNSTGIGMDGAGNLYYADRAQFVIRKVHPITGIVNTVAGVALSSGHAGDGGPATSAYLSNNIRGLHVTTAGDVFIADDAFIRKVSGATGIITTVAGGGYFTADGVPATASLISVSCVYVDAIGNIYYGTDNKIKKVHATSGLVTTIAGTGGAIDAGDGGPAIAADIAGTAKSICMDNTGSLYIIAGTSNRVRKIDGTTGIITTVAGGGSSTAEGVPATTAAFTGLHTCGVDGMGNIFIADRARHLVRRVDAATGIINTVAGTAAGGSTVEGVTALSAFMRPYMILVNSTSGSIYYSDSGTKVRKFPYTPLLPYTAPTPPSYTSDSMAAFITKECTGMQLFVRINSYAGLTLRTYFGDGHADTSAVAVTWSGVPGYVHLTHAYPVAGIYSVKHILCSGGIPVDTLSYNYDQLFCTGTTVRFYNDEDLSCTKSTSESFLMNQVVTEIDSNGIPIDTIAATAGFNYAAYRSSGDIYTFRILSSPHALYPSCPSTGIVYDTLHTGITSNSHFMALACMTGSNVDLEVKGDAILTGTHHQAGNIYIQNNYCTPSNASVTLHFSPKFQTTGGTYPTPISSTATSMTWSLNDIVGTETAVRKIHYKLWRTTYPNLTDGDTVNEQMQVIPTSGIADIHMGNNTDTRTDTVRTSFDPNAMEVTPSCFDNDTTLHFTVHFENIGSAPAVNIYVMDTLSALLDPSSLNIEMSTHTMFITKSVVDNKTILKFDFPNINLADSSDHINRDGMFMYTMKNRAAMTTGTTAQSRVGIYFDYNDVLMTNTASATKGCPVLPASVTNAAASSFYLYPNPAADELTIEATAGRYTQLTICNIVGQQLLQQDILQPRSAISVKHLQPGLYYVTMQGAGGTSVRKFVKK